METLEDLNHFDFKRLQEEEEFIKDLKWDEPTPLLFIRSFPIQNKVIALLQICAGKIEPP